MDAKTERKARNGANTQLAVGTKSAYFQSIPNQFIDAVLTTWGFRPLEPGIYCGRDGSIHEQVGDRTWFTMTWHKMDESGRYEIVAYLS